MANKFFVFKSSMATNLGGDPDPGVQTGSGSATLQSAEKAIIDMIMVIIIIPNYARPLHGTYNSW